MRMNQTSQAPFNKAAQRKTTIYTLSNQTEYYKLHKDGNHCRALVLNMIGYKIQVLSYKVAGHCILHRYIATTSIDDHLNELEARTLSTL